MKGSIEKLRVEYGNTPLDEINMQTDPLMQFAVWMQEAIKAKVFEPNGMILSTVGSAGRPSSRTVLLKGWDQKGFIFFTNYASRKAEHLELHPFASLTFWWKEIYRQINIEGKVIKVSRSLSAQYFSKRPKNAQIAALASSQSAPLATRIELEEIFARLKKKYRGSKVPCPKNWGGYRLIPDRIEFWQGRANRLHDRYAYLKANKDWMITRLFP